MDEALKELGIKMDITRSMLTVALILTRILTVVTIAPFLGGKQSPPEVKMGTSIALTAVILPVVANFQTGPLPIDPLNFFLMVLKEAFVGFLLGFIAAELFYAVEMAGKIVDLARGTNQVQLMVPQIGERSSAFGDMNYQLLIVVFMAIGGHHVFIMGMMESFRIIPLDTWPKFSAGLWPLVDFFARLSADIFTIGVTLSAPVVLACLITELVFGLLNRVSAQINAYFMAMPAKVFVGGTMFLLAFPSFIKILVDHASHIGRLLAHTMLLLK